MAAITICSDFGAPQNKVWHCFYCFPIYFPELMGPDAMIFVFWMLSFKPTFSLSSFTFIKRLFSSSSLSAIRVVLSAYLRLLIFLLFSLTTWYVRGPVLGLGTQQWLWPSAHLCRADTQVGEMDSGQIYKSGCEKCQEEETVEGKKKNLLLIRGFGEGVLWGSDVKLLALWDGGRQRVFALFNDSAGNIFCVDMSRAM